MRKTVLSLVVALVAGFAAAAPAGAYEAEMAPPPPPSITEPGFVGNCVITGTVVPFTTFGGEGYCTGYLDGVRTSDMVFVRAMADGTHVGVLPAQQTGEGSVYFARAARRINFTFEQVGTNLVLKGEFSGTAVGEVTPLDVTGSIRYAAVVAHTVNNLN